LLNEASSRIRVSSWAGSLWRLLNEELMDPANSSTDLDADEVGGSG